MKKHLRVLVIEDDRRIADLVKKRLEHAGHVTDHAGDGRTGLAAAMGRQYDVLVIDRLLPHMEGLEITSRLRDAGKTTPILLLSALGEVDDRVKGLRAGGDDYLVKPFASEELLARIDALARRPHLGEHEGRMIVAGLTVDLISRSVFREGKAIRLKPREFRLLEYLLRHEGMVVTREMILEGVWGLHFDPQTNIVDVHISGLRRKVDEGFSEPLIHTVRGIGYVLRKGE